jgi:hypothetical protein
VKEINHLGDLSADGTIILKLFLGAQGCGLDLSDSEWVVVMGASENMEYWVS